MSTGSAQAELRDLGLERGGRWLFRGLNVSLPRGRLIALTGRSGAGKSSLLACQSGSLDPSAGEILFHHAAGGTAPPVDFRRRIGVVFQNFLLIGNGTVLHNVLCGRLGRHAWWRTLFGFPTADRVDALAILQELELTSHAQHRAGEISGGEQQRTALARALLQEPEVFLADEPVSNLDAALSEKVLELLRFQAHTHGRTVLCVLHSEDFVRRFADIELHLDAAHPDGWILRQPQLSPPSDEP